MRSLPRIVSQIPADLRNFLDRVREYMGSGGDDRFVTLSELKRGGIVGTTPGGTIIEPTPGGVETPRMPTGLTATGAFATILVEWDTPNYLGHAYTEIWAAPTDDFSTKELVGTAEGTIFSHNLGNNATRYYWIRFVNKLDTVGAFNALAGTRGDTSQDPAYLLEVLAGSITDAELSAALNTQIDTNTTQITGVRNLYTVKMDNNGYLAGFGLMSNLSEGGTPTSDFFVNVNRFAVTTPTSSIPTRANSTAYAVGAFVGVASSTSKMLVAKVGGTSGTSAPNISATAIGSLITDGTVVWQVASRVPLSVLTTTATINGTTVTPGVYIDGAAIVNATINNAQIANLAVDDAKISALSASKITAGTLQVGSYIESQSYSSGVSGWRINANGSAEFAQAVVRGSIFGGNATSYSAGTGLFAGVDGGTYKFRVGTASGSRLQWDGSSLTVVGTLAGSTILGGSASSYSAGTGLFAGVDGGTYKFRVGTDSGSRMQWDGSALTVVGTLAGSTILGGSASSYSAGTGMFAGVDGGAYKWRVGDPSGAFVRWTGAGLELSAGATNLVGTTNIVPNAVTQVWVGLLPLEVAVDTTAGVFAALPSITMPFSGLLVTQVFSVIHNFSTGTTRDVQMDHYVAGESLQFNLPILSMRHSAANAAFLPLQPLNTTSGNSLVMTTVHENDVTQGQVVPFQVFATPNANNTTVYIVDAYYVATLYKR